MNTIDRNTTTAIATATTTTDNNIDAVVIEQAIQQLTEYKLSLHADNVAPIDTKPINNIVIDTYHYTYQLHSYKLYQQYIQHILSLYIALVHQDGSTINHEMHDILYTVKENKNILHIFYNLYCTWNLYNNIEPPNKQFIESIDQYTQLYIGNVLPMYLLFDQINQSDNDPVQQYNTTNQLCTLSDLITNITKQPCSYTIQLLGHLFNYTDTVERTKVCCMIGNKLCARGHVSLVAAQIYNKTLQANNNDSTQLNVVRSIVQYTTMNYLQNIIEYILSQNNISVLKHLFGDVLSRPAEQYSTFDTQVYNILCNKLLFVYQCKYIKLIIDLLYDVSYYNKHTTMLNESTVFDRVLIQSSELLSKQIIYNNYNDTMKVQILSIIELQLDILLQYLILDSNSDISIYSSHSSVTYLLNGISNNFNTKYSAIINQHITTIATLFSRLISPKNPIDFNDDDDEKDNNIDLTPSELDTDYMTELQHERINNTSSNFWSIDTIDNNADTIQPLNTVNIDDELYDIVPPNNLYVLADYFQIYNKDKRSIKNILSNLVCGVSIIRRNANYENHELIIELFNNYIHCSEYLIHSHQTYLQLRIDCIHSLILSNLNQLVPYIITNKLLSVNCSIGYKIDCVSYLFYTAEQLSRQHQFYQYSNLYFHQLYSTLLDGTSSFYISKFDITIQEKLVELYGCLIEYCSNFHIIYIRYSLQLYHIITIVLKHNQYQNINLVQICLVSFIKILLGCKGNTRILYDIFHDELEQLTSTLVYINQSIDNEICHKLSNNCLLEVQAMLSIDSNEMKKLELFTI